LCPGLDVEGFLLGFWNDATDKFKPLFYTKLHYDLFLLNRNSESV
jgi:hypothetical protein